VKRDWRRWLETAFWIDLLIHSIPVVVLMVLAIWLVSRAFGSW
jgi:hypothetical protein